MGRVARYWKAAFEEAGFTFIHMGKEEVVSLRHPYFFPSMALKQVKQIIQAQDLLLVHEPAAGYFANLSNPLILFSHGVEQREWNVRQQFMHVSGEKISLKSRIMYPYWRLRAANRGLRKADLLLLINQQDRQFVIEKYGRESADIFIFRNGIRSLSIESQIKKPDDQVRILFNGSWIKRKGIQTLVQTAELLYRRSISVKWLFIGTAYDKPQVLQDFPVYLRPAIEVIPRFRQEEESYYLSQADIYVLPSFYEGQPLSLLQAMAAGLCCISTACCGQLDIIEDGKNGLLYETGNHLMLADQLQKCIADGHFRKSLGQQAKEKVRDRSWEKVSTEVVELVRNRFMNFKKHI